MEGINTTR